MSEHIGDTRKELDKLYKKAEGKRSPVEQGVVTTDCARQINEYLKGLSSYDERLQLLEIMSDDICIHCGDVNKGICHCTNDESCFAD